MTKLFVTDLDGTLLRSDATLSPFSRATLRRLLEQGVLFTIATARSAMSVRGVAGDLPLTLPVIEMDGAQITDLATGNHWIIRSLPSDLALSLREVLRGNGHEPIVVCSDGQDDHLHFHDVWNDGLRWYRERLVASADPRLRDSGNIDAAFDLQVTSLILVDRLQPLRAIRREVAAQFGGAVSIMIDENPYTPEWHWLRVQHASVSKGNALRDLAERVGIPLEATVGFGDSHNDISLLAAAGHGVAMENAIPELKATADEIIGHCDEDSVVRWIAAALSA